LYVDAKSVERNEAYESFSAACTQLSVSTPLLSVTKHTGILSVLRA
jgi:hypothetical protein